MIYRNRSWLLNNERAVNLVLLLDQTRCSLFKHLGPVIQSWFSVNPGLKFNPLFWFVCFNASLSFKFCEKKTSNNPGKIYEKIFSLLYKKGLGKFASNFELTQG